MTLRPRGHPFDRRPVLAPSVAASLAGRADRRFIVVDEGPGLSGSSIAGTVALLTELGVPLDDIVVIPTWRTDGRALRSALARDWWPRLHQLTGDFAQVWIASGRLSEAFGTGPLVDISAGAWREHWVSPGDPWPAVQPQHERRKYLMTGSPPCALRFVGLGRYGTRRLERAQELATAGFIAAPTQLAHGFLGQTVVSGCSLRADDVDAELLDRMAGYLAHLREAHQADPLISSDCLSEMIVHNLAIGLGAEWADRARRALSEAAWGDRACVLDGRMLPHEWVRGPSGDFKTDALDHGDDHFLPGPQDIAWDLAGAEIEFQLDAPAAAQLLDRYAAYSRDTTVTRRLPTYRLAYLAFRLGYCAVAADSLAQTLDGRRFRLAAARYAAATRRLLSGRSLPAVNAVGRRAAQRVGLIIFDADGTLRRTSVAGHPCPLRGDEWKLRPAARATVRRLLARRTPPRLGIASNQDRVGWGQISLVESRSLLRELGRALAGRALPDEAVQICPHRADEGCPCHKPAPAMLQRIMAFYRIPRERTLFIGDAETDREAARRAGVGFAWARAFFRAGGRLSKRSAGSSERRNRQTRQATWADSYDGASSRTTRA